MKEVIVSMNEDGTHDIENPDNIKVIIRDFNVDPECFQEGDMINEMIPIYKDEDSDALYAEYIYGGK